MAERSILSVRYKVFLISIMAFFIIVRMNTPQEIELAIYPTAIAEESYYFKLTDNGELLVKKGERISDNLTNNPFIGVIDISDKKNISTNEVASIFFDVKNICDKRYSQDSLMTDTWYIQILYNKKMVGQNYPELSSDVKMLVDKFIEISPIHVNIHSW